MPGLGLAALACWGVHAADSVWRRGEPQNLLWACNLGALGVAAGLLSRSAALTAVMVLWLTLGIVMWALDLLGGADFIPTALLTHIGGLVLGVLGLHQLGMPEGIWWKALASLLALQLACRFVTDPADNVNIAFSVWKGWERMFPSYRVYWALNVSFTAGLFAGVEAGLRRAL